MHSAQKEKETARKGVREMGRGLRRGGNDLQHAICYLKYAKL